MSAATADIDKFAQLLDSAALKREEVVMFADIAGVDPNAAWNFETDASAPPVVARMQSPDSTARADIQVQEVPGVPLDRVKGMIEQAIASQTQDFKKLSDTNTKVGGMEAYELAFLVTSRGSGPSLTGVSSESSSAAGLAFGSAMPWFGSMKSTITSCRRASPSTTSP